MISKDTEAEALRLYHAEKWPIGTIAKQLGVHHTTIQRILRHTGVDAKLVAPRASIVDPFIPFVKDQLNKYPRIQASRLFVMVKERGYTGGSDHFRKLVGRLRPRKPAEAFQRLRTLPGEQAQVDWAHFGKLQIGKALRPLWAFVMVLSYSRRIFLRFFPGASMPFFLQGHVDAFADFEGIPRVLLYDNLKSAVLERRGDAIRFHPTLLELSAHYRFEPRPVAVARGNEKGRVERAIRYIRGAFFAARPFADLNDLNAQALDWTRGEASERTWVEDRSRSVRDAFAEEQSRLLPPPDVPFPALQRVEVEIGKTPYARFDLNDYSVPHDRTQRTLVVFADLNQVRIADGQEIVATHLRSWDRGQQIEDSKHLTRLVEEKQRARQHRGFDRLARSTTSSTVFMGMLAERGGNLGSTTARLLDLLDSVGGPALEEALAEAVSHKTVHLGAVRQIIDRKRSEGGLAPPLTVPIARGEHAHLVVKPHALGTYDVLKKDISQ